MDWWTPSKVYKGGSTVRGYQVPLAKFPVFHRKGSILPLDVKNSYGGHGDARSAPYLTLLISHLSADAYAAVREEGTATNPVAQEFRYGFDSANRELTFSATAHSRKLLLLIRGVQVDQNLRVAMQHSTTNSDADVIVERSSLAKLYNAGQGWFYNHAKSELWIIPGESSAGLLINLQGIQEEPVY